MFFQNILEQCIDDTTGIYWYQVVPYSQQRKRFFKGTVWWKHSKQRRVEIRNDRCVLLNCVVGRFPLDILKRHHHERNIKLFPAVFQIRIRVRIQAESTCFWAIRIRILISLRKYSKKNLNFCSFVTSFWLFIFENDV